MDAASLEFLPIGNDSNARVYKVLTNKDAPLFLKVKSKPTYSASASLRIPRFHNNGVKQIIAPLRTAADELWGQRENSPVILYPFIGTQMGANIGLSDQQWVEFGRLFGHIHSLSLPPVIRDQLRQELFAPKSTALVHQMRAEIDTHDFSDPVSTEMAKLWRERNDEIREIADRAGGTSSRNGTALLS